MEDVIIDKYKKYKLKYVEQQSEQKAIFYLNKCLENKPIEKLVFYQFPKDESLYTLFRNKLVEFINSTIKSTTFYEKKQVHETYYCRQYLIDYLKKQGYPDNDIIKFQSHYSIEDITYIIQNKK